MDSQMAMLDNVRCQVWVLLDSQTYDLANQAHAQFLGRRPEELKGRDLREVWSKDEAERQIADNADVFRHKREAESREWLTNGKGELRLLTIAKKPILDDENEVKYVVCSAEDVTELEIASRALRESELRYEIFTDGAPLAIFLADELGRYLEVNRAACQLSGYTKEELLDLSIPQFVAPEYLAEGMATFTEVKEKGRAEVEVMVVRKDGVRLWINLVGLAVASNRFIAFCQNITERRRADDRVRYLSFHDVLTGLYNRAYLEQEMERLDTARQLPIGIIMADLNHLKHTNDTYGHQRGDELLKCAADVLRSSCREEDIIARYGGDEFVILLPQAAEDNVKAVCERILTRSKESAVGGKPLSLALGAAIKSNIEQQLDRVVAEAEDNMYEHKRQQRLGI